MVCYTLKKKEIKIIIKNSTRTKLLVARGTEFFFFFLVDLPVVECFISLIKIESLSIALNIQK